jgi:hypothetical protein
MTGVFSMETPVLAKLSTTGLQRLGPTGHWSHAIVSHSCTTPYTRSCRVIETIILATLTTFLWVSCSTLSCSTGSTRTQYSIVDFEIKENSRLDLFYQLFLAVLSFIQPGEIRAVGGGATFGASPPPPDHEKASLSKYS